MLIVSALSRARSQEFVSPRHMCCGDVTVKVILINLIQRARVSYSAYVVFTTCNCIIFNLI